MGGGEGATAAGRPGLPSGGSRRARDRGAPPPRSRPLISAMSAAGCWLRPGRCSGGRRARLAARALPGGSGRRARRGGAPGIPAPGARHLPPRGPPTPSSQAPRLGQPLPLPAACAGGVTVRGGGRAGTGRERRRRGGGGGGGCAILAGVPAILAGGGRGPAPAWGLRGESAVSDFQAPRPRPRGGGGLGRIYVVIVKDREHPRGRSGWIDQGRDRAGPRAGPVGSSRPPIARGWRAPPRPQRARPPRVTRQHRGSGRGGRAPAPGGNRGGPPQAGPARPSRGSRTRPPGRRPRALSGVG